MTSQIPFAQSRVCSAGLAIALVLLAFACRQAMGQTYCPGAPINIAAESRACKVRVSWAPADSNYVSQYQLWRGTNPAFASAAMIATFNSSITVYDDNPPLEGTSYWYWVGTIGLSSFPFNCPNPNPAAIGGPAAGQKLPFAPSPAPQVQALCGGITVTWTLPNGATGVELKRFIPYQGYDKSWMFGASTLSYTDTTAVAGVGYRYAAVIQTECGAAASGQNSYPDVYRLTAPNFTLQPNDTATSVGQYTWLQVAISSQTAVTGRWEKDGVAVADGGRISGATQAVLSIYPVRTDDIGFYAFRASNSCGNSLSASALLAVRVPCRADFDQNGSLQVVDIFEFLNTWFAACP